MSVVTIPFSGTNYRSAPPGPTMWAMTIGQHAAAVVLTVIGMVRALEDGTSAAAVIIAGAAVLVWHTAGTLVVARPRWQQWAGWWLLGLALLWLAAIAITPEFVWLAFLLWLLAGHLLALRWGLLFSISVLAGVVSAPILHHGTLNYADVFGPLIGGIFAFGISRGYLQLLHEARIREQLVVSLTRTQQEMADLQDELAVAQRHSGALAERTRISRDIHDTLAQSLASMRLLAHAEPNHAELAAASRTLAQIETLAGDSLADVRRILEALVPAELESDALTAALQRMLDRTRSETGIQVELYVDDSLPLLTTQAEVALLRTAQSALANVRQHAHASRVAVNLIDAGDSVRLEIIDDGTGFDATSWEHATHTTSSSFGLRFMQSRLRELGGEVNIDSSPVEGTAISVHLPIHSGIEDKS
jgi:signal transduction histidine kinase